MLTSATPAKAAAPSYLLSLLTAAMMLKAKLLLLTNAKNCCVITAKKHKEKNYNQLIMMTHPDKNKTVCGSS